MAEKKPKKTEEFLLKIKEAQEEAEKIVNQSKNSVQLENARVKILGRSGFVNEILKSLADLSVQERKIVGPKAQELKSKITNLIEDKKEQIEKEFSQEKLKTEWIDVSAPGKKIERGHLHPLTQMEEKISSIFEKMGFSVVGGPEMESEWYNFDALNIPKDHPARDLWDTFWIKRESENIKVAGAENFLMRTHTSPVQVRFMEKHQPPFQIIAPGRVFRFENTDATHEVQFYQIEGLMVGKDVSFANMKAVITSFLKGVFGTSSKTRFRPSFFPFVEPGVEIDVSCFNCGGKGCGICKHSGWIEIMGAGMVHPAVFRAVGYDTSEISGLAFGMGLDRLTMLKYKIDDVRLLYQNDLRFLKQF